MSGKLKRECYGGLKGIELSKFRTRYGPQHTSSLVQKTLKYFGLQDRLAERAPIERWPEVVGSNMATHTRAVDIKNKVLILEADHGAWRQEVTMLIPMIIKKYNAMFGEGTVEEISWRDRPKRSGHGRRQG